MGKEVVLVLSSPSHPDSTITLGVSSLLFSSFPQIRINALQGQIAPFPPSCLPELPRFVHALNINIRINSYGNIMKVFLW